MVQLGDRVGAILDSDNGKVKLFGFGIYEGEFEATDAVGMMADVVKKAHHPNPRILLDNGKMVYGCECWWGTEEQVKNFIKDKEIENVDIDEVRSKFKEDVDKQIS